VIETVKTVLWGMVGIRRKADHEKTPLNPVHLAIAAIGFVVLFILTLVTIVRIVTS
jgi:high-affinity K+ transport system ATPase subunit B